MARAAASRGLPYCLSTAGTSTIEDVAATGHRDLWFQLIDSGIRHGADVAVAIARGADLCMVGRVGRRRAAGHRAHDLVGLGRGQIASGSGSSGVRAWSA